jgi:hypothetical protein
MVNAIPAGMLTVRELRAALNAAAPEQVVCFSLAHDDLAVLNADVSGGLDVIFAVKIGRADPRGPVFKLTSTGPTSLHIEVAADDPTG